VVVFGRVCSRRQKVTNKFKWIGLEYWEKIAGKKKTTVRKERVIAALQRRRFIQLKKGASVIPGVRSITLQETEKLRGDQSLKGS